MNRSHLQFRLWLWVLPVIALIYPVTINADEVHGVYMLRLDDEIGSSTWRYTRQALDEASRLDAELLIVHLNTYGGSVVHADSIRTALLNFPRPTVAFVDNNAASAGALVALACDSVFMRSGASMGAVTVVNGTDGMAMPDKYQSYMRAMMRATAERHGKPLARTESRNGAAIRSWQKLWSIRGSVWAALSTLQEC